MDEWKNWLDADYAFSDNGEKIKKVVKGIYKVGIVLSFISIILGLFVVLISILNGGFQYVWHLPFILILTFVLAPFLLYWNLSFLYGFGELISNSYNRISTAKPCDEDHSKTQHPPAEEATQDSPIKETVSVSNKESGEHKWRCIACGNMISEDICPICKKDNSVVTTTTNQAKVSPAKKEDTIVCPICNFEQRANRKVCWNCGAKFENSK